jgi:nucleotide-binding universal stress UspA family protein
MKILLAVDGSECSLNATRKVIADVGYLKETPSVELLAVHLPIPPVPNLGLVIDQDTIERFYREDCEQMLAPARALLDAAGVKYSAKMRTGPIAESIAAEADATKSDYLVMGTHGRTALGSMVLGSVANRVLHLTKVPIVLIH